MMRHASAPHSYWLAWSVQLLGDVDIPALHHAAALVTARHPSLRTRIVATSSGPDTALVAAPDADPPITTASPRNVSRARGTFFADVIGTNVLDGDRPWRMALLDGPDGCELALATHHLVFDQWSLGLFLADLGAAYRHRTAGVPLPPSPALTYTDYARWQRLHLRGSTYQHHLDHWRRLADGVTHGVSYPSSAGARPPSGPSQTLHTPIERDLLDRLSAVADGRSTTLFLVLLALFAAAVGREAGTEDVLVGAVTANRRLRGTADVIGFYANGRFLRTAITPATTPANLIGAVSAQWAEGHRHQELHLEKTVLDIGKPDLVNVKFSLRNVLAGSAGTWVVEPAVLELIAPDGPVDFSLHVLPTLPTSSHRLGVYDAGPTRLRDFGQFETYLQGNLEALAGDHGLTPAGTPLGPGIWVEDHTTIHPTATLTGPPAIGRHVAIGPHARLVGPAVIGHRANIGAGATIVRSVVLPGTTVGTGTLTANAVAADLDRVVAALEPWPKARGLAHPGSSATPRRPT